MKVLRQIWEELVGLFVDDGALATQVALLAAAVTLATRLLGVPALWGAMLLLPGCLVILAASLMRAKPKSSGS